MAFAADRGGAVSAINVVPLIDVLLVLLIIFMVTAPMLTQEIPLQLSRGEADADEPKQIRLRIGAGGLVHWDGQPLPRAAWQASLAIEARRSPQPVIEIEGSDETAYRDFAEVLAYAHDRGLTRIGLVQPSTLAGPAPR